MTIVAALRECLGATLQAVESDGRSGGQTTLEGVREALRGHVRTCSDKPRNRRSSPWPRGLRPLRENDPLAELPDSHPAKQALICQMKCQRECVGREIVWQGRELDAFDQSWESALLGRSFSFSSFAYCFVSCSLILDGWLSHPPSVTNFETKILSSVPVQNMLLDECEQAANAQGNERVLECSAKIRHLNRLLLESVHLRLTSDGIPIPSMPRGLTPAELLGLTFPRSR